MSPAPRWAGVVLVCGLEVFGASVAASSPPAPPGKLIDLGGYAVHLHCSGSGGPPVILLHGEGEYSFDWALVQPAVALQEQVCAYDRPGQAWSAPAGSPRSLETSARELRRLLDRAAIRGPYVLVGHSWGGLIARLYASLYPKDVAGMVLVDSTHEDDYVAIQEEVVRPRAMSDKEWSALRKRKPKSAARRAVDDDAPPAMAPPRPATEPAAKPSRQPELALPPPFDQLPPAVQSLQRWAAAQPRTAETLAGGDSADLRQDFLAMDRVRQESPHPLGRIPLIVLSKTPDLDNDDDFDREQLAWNREMQSQLATQSTDSLHWFLKKSGHHIELDAPATVVEAIRRVTEAVRLNQPVRDDRPQKP